MVTEQYSLLNQQDNKEGVDSVESQVIGYRVTSSTVAALNLTQYVPHQNKCLFQRSFVTKRLLGRGGFGIVYLCHSRRNGRLYAVKTGIKLNDNLSMFEEYDTAKKIKGTLCHPNLVNALGCIRENQLIYVIFELASGGDLSAEIDNRGYFSSSEAAGLGKQLLLGLSYIHSKGFLHRDIKPANLLIIKKIEPYHIKLSDFGLTINRKRCSTNSKSNVNGEDQFERHSHGFAGTDGYIAPEIVLGELYDFECDTWSAGCAIYEMICGTLPFEDSAVKDGQIMEVQFPMPEWRGEELAIDALRAIFKRHHPNTCDQILEHKFFVQNQHPNSNARSRFLTDDHYHRDKSDC